jgi:hypothetical protein
MPEYQVQIKAESLEELKKLLEGRVIPVYGYYVAMAKSAVTSACMQVVRMHVEAAEMILRGTMQQLVQAKRRAVLVAESEEIDRAVQIVRELVDRLRGPDQTQAVEYCHDWLGAVRR